MHDLFVRVLTAQEAAEIAKIALYILAVYAAGMVFIWWIWRPRKRRPPDLMTSDEIARKVRAEALRRGKSC